MNKEFLFDMLETPSCSGEEIGLQTKLLNHLKENGVTTKTDNSGNIYALMNQESPIKVLLTGHIDEIGLMVIGYTGEGLLKVMKCGGIYAQHYIGQKVRVLTENGVLYGAVVNGSAIWKNEKLSDENILIDIGVTSKEEAEKVVKHGDRVIVDTGVRELLNNRIAARAMDDRIGVYIVLKAFLKAREKGCNIGVCSTTTVGEETNMRGAYAAAMNYLPTCAIAVDVTYASDYPHCNTVYGDIQLDKGPVLCHAPYINKKLNKLLTEAAERLNMHIQWEGASSYTGTDADKMHFTSKGVPVALVSIPLRYMHAPAEVGSLKDIEECVDLLAEFLVGLSEDVNFNPFE